MSDTQQGPDWWQASDGKWYPPESSPPAGGPGPASGGGSSLSPVDAKGFFRSLYDFQFDSLVTPKLIRLFYAIAVVVLSIMGAMYMLFALAMLTQSAGVGLLLIIMVPIVYVLYLIMTRIWFELIAVFFRIGEDIRVIRDRGSV